MSNNPQPTRADEERNGFTEGLRALADLLDQHTEIPLPFHGHANGLRSSRPFHLAGADGDRLIEALGCPARVEVRETGELWLTWHIAGIAVMTSSGVCEKTVTGVRVIGGREVPVTEYQVPERFRPVPAEATKVGV